MSNLFKSVKAIQHIDDGYALQFHRSDNLEDLIGIMADYIVFESLNSPQLTFSIVEEPLTKTFWFQVRGLETDGHDVTSPSIPFDSAVSPLV